MAEPYYASAQKGTPGHCFAAQVFGVDGRSMLTIDPTEDEETASKHAKFIADAFNVLHETGMGPRELQEQVATLSTQRAELLEALKEASGQLSNFTTNCVGGKDYLVIDSIANARDLIAKLEGTQEL